MSDSTQLPLGNKTRPPVHDLESSGKSEPAERKLGENVSEYMSPPPITPPTPEDFGLDPETMEEAKKAPPSGNTSALLEKPDTKEKALLEPVGYGGFNNTQIAILRATSFKDCKTPEAVAVACSVAKKYDLDPFVQEIWAIDMQGKMVIQASAAGWRKMITRDEKVKRLISNAVYKGDTLKIDHINGVIDHVQNIKEDTTHDEKEKPLGAYAAALMEDGKWIAKYVRWEEYAKDQGPWKVQKSEMICNKAVTVLGRSSFGVSGVYLPGEVTGDILDLPSGEFEETRIETGKAAKAALRAKKS